MKENYQQRETPDEAPEGVKMSLAEEATVQVMKAIIGLYAKPGEAILREITSNAWDSHQVVGQTRPVEVTIPSYNNPELIVEDFGVGLNWSTIPDAFSKIGFSTKRDDNRQRGAFGFGAKSPILLADAFTITGVKDGVHTVVECRKNSEGIGEFFLRSENPTDEPNGVKLTIPISDYRQFNIDDILTNFFIGWERDSVKINGQFPRRCLADAKQFTALEIGGEPIGWISRDNHSSTSIRIFASFGGVIYPIKHPDYYDPYYEAFNKLRNYGRLVYLNLPLASVETTPSREALTYNQVTMKALKLSLNAVATAIELETQQQLELAANKRDAIRLYTAALHDKLWLSDLSYRGERVPNSFTLGAPVFVVQKQTRRRSDNTYTYVADRTNAQIPILDVVDRKSYIVHIDDATQVDSLKRKYNYFLQGVGEHKVDLYLHVDDVSGSWFEAAANHVLTVDEFNKIATKGRKTYEAKKPEKTATTFLVASGPMDDYILRVRRLTAEKIVEEAGSRPILHLAHDAGSLGKVMNKNLRKYSAVRLGSQTANVMRALLSGSTVILTENLTMRKKLDKEMPDLAQDAMVVLHQRAELEVQKVQTAQQGKAVAQRLLDTNNNNWSRHHAFKAFGLKLQEQGSLDSIRQPELRSALQQLIEPYERVTVSYNSDLVNWFRLDTRVSQEDQSEAKHLERIFATYQFFPNSSSFGWSPERIQHALAYINAIDLPESITNPVGS